MVNGKVPNGVALVVVIVSVDEGPVAGFGLKLAVVPAGRLEGMEKKTAPGTAAKAPDLEIFTMYVALLVDIMLWGLGVTVGKEKSPVVAAC
jgi:hypothetical protein